MLAAIPKIFKRIHCCPELASLMLKLSVEFSHHCHPSCALFVFLETIISCIFRIPISERTLILVRKPFIFLFIFNESKCTLKIITLELSSLPQYSLRVTKASLNFV
ncbi:hypothetical protein D3C80_1279210 [compost metagenome]